MATDLATYTGTITYRNIVFSFIFDRRELRLIPPADKTSEVERWFMEELIKGVDTTGDPVYIEAPFLEGKTNETGQTIVFIPSQRKIGRHKSGLFVPVNAYIIKKYDRQQIDRMAFKSAELDCLSPVTQALCGSEWSNDGVVSFTTKNFDDTTTEKRYFLSTTKR